MRAGSLKHRVVIEQAVDTRGDTFNEAKIEWETFREVHAAINPLSGRELFASEQASASVSHRIEMRYLAGVTPKHRIRWGERIFEIQHVINVDERNRELQLMCWEKV